MPRKPYPAVLVPPPVVRPPRGRSVSLWLRDEDIEAIDAVAKRMNGTRSDAIRWLLSLVNGSSAPR